MKTVIKEKNVSSVILNFSLHPQNSNIISNWTELDTSSLDKGMNFFFYVFK